MFIDIFFFLHYTIVLIFKLFLNCKNTTFHKSKEYRIYHVVKFESHIVKESERRDYHHCVLSKSIRGETLGNSSFTSYAHIGFD